jgi:hypothetical protein
LGPGEGRCNNNSYGGKYKTHAANISCGGENDKYIKYEVLTLEDNPKIRKKEYPGGYTA